MTDKQTLDNKNKNKKIKEFQKDNAIIIIINPRPIKIPKKANTRVIYNPSKINLNLSS